jgi:hypothetical protein
LVRREKVVIGGYTFKEGSRRSRIEKLEGESRRELR